MAKQKFYVVFEGRETGLFFSWDKVKQLVDGFSGCKHKSFKTRKEAQTALDEYQQQKLNTSAQAESFDTVELTEVDLDGIFDGSDDDCPF